MPDSPTIFASNADARAVESSTASDSAEAPFPSRIIALLTSDRTGGDLVGGCTWTVNHTADGTAWSATIIGEVEGNSLLAEHVSDTLTVAVYGYVLSASGDPIGHIHQVHALPLADHEPRLRATGLRVVQPLQLTSSPVSVRLVIENADTQRFLVSTLDLAAPSADADLPTLLSPLVHDVADAWLVVTPAGEQPSAGRVTLHGQDFVPATRMVAVNGQPTELVVVAAGAEMSAPIAARIVDRNGVTRANPRVAVGSRLNPGNTPPAMFSTTLEAVDLPPDLYLLELTLDDPRLPTRVLHSLPMAVTEDSRHVVWTAAGIAAQEAPEADPSQLEARELGSIGAYTAALLLSGQRGGEVHGSMTWSIDPTGFTGDVAEVPFFVELEGASLLTAQSGPTLHLGVFAYVLSSEGGLAGHLAQGLSLDLRSYGEQLRNSGLKFAGKFDLPAGSYVLHLLVRNQDTGGMTLKLAHIDVPGGDSHGAVLLPPVFPEPAGSWLVTRQHGLDAESIGIPIADTRVVPAARAVVESGRPTDLFIGTAGCDRDTPISTRVVDIQGRHLAEPLLTVGHEAEVATSGTSFFRATLGALDLPVGWYMLELTLEDEASGARRSRSIPVAVIVNRRPTVWASLSKTVQSDVQSPRPTAAGTGIVPPTNGAIVAGYLAALRVLADGDRYAARDRIADLERSVGAAGSSAAMSGLYRAQMRVARELAEVEPEALIPIVLVHRDVFRHYLATGENRLADHAWRLTAALAEEVPPGSRLDRGPAFPETVLVAIGADLVRMGLTTSAIELLERAVELAPHDRGALLALGATYERMGDYAEAVPPLRTLVEEHLDSAEGALRLAVNLSRTGSPDEAARHFRQLTTDRTPAWVQVISHQELARLLPGAAAEALLQEALARFPSDQALRIQLAQLLDTRGRPWEAGSLIDEVASRAWPPESSPRVRYLAWPSLGLEQRLVEFERTAEASAAALVTAIQAHTAVPETS
jgi:tetratricopeptide (TPR) repeat protein